MSSRRHESLHQVLVDGRAQTPVWALRDVSTSVPSIYLAPQTVCKAWPSGLVLEVCGPSFHVLWGSKYSSSANMQKLQTMNLQALDPALQLPQFQSYGLHVVVNGSQLRIVGGCWLAFMSAKWLDRFPFLSIARHCHLWARETGAKQMQRNKRPACSLSANPSV